MPRPCCSRTSRRNPGSTWHESPTRRSLSAVNAQRKFGFRAASTDTNALLEDHSIDAVFIVTRHSAHADLTCRALEAGKAVFVEKPLALTSDELDRILATVDATGNDRIMVGFNRRFAPLLVDMRKRFGRSSEPTNARYLVNAGRLASDSWYRDAELEGSRFVGEGGHFVDTMSWWIGSDPVEVDDTACRRRRGDAGEPSLRRRISGDHHLPDGSTPSLSQGDLRGIEWWADRPTRQFQTSHRLVGHACPHPSASGFDGQGSAAPRSRPSSSSVRTGGPMPISLESLTATTRATLAAAAGVARRTPQKL